MKKTVYEKLLKRIDGERSKNSAETDSRFELPPVDVMWEGQRTYLRNFSDFQKYCVEILQNYYNICQKNLLFLLNE